MKKILYLIALLLFVKVSSAQIDTTAVLNTLLNNKANYIGQPCSKLLNDLPLMIKYYRAPLPFPYLPDTLNIAELDLVFIDNNQAVGNISRGWKIPQIIIYFTAPIPTPKRYFKRGYILEVGKDWDMMHAIYFGQAIVSDFVIRGL